MVKWFKLCFILSLKQTNYMNYFELNTKKYLGLDDMVICTKSKTETKDCELLAILGET